MRQRCFACRWPVSEINERAETHMEQAQFSSTIESDAAPAKRRIRTKPKKLSDFVHGDGEVELMLTIQIACESKLGHVCFSPKRRIEKKFIEWKIHEGFYLIMVTTKAMRTHRGMYTDGIRLWAWANLHKQRWKYYESEVHLSLVWSPTCWLQTADDHLMFRAVIFKHTISDNKILLSRLTINQILQWNMSCRRHGWGLWFITRLVIHLSETPFAGRTQMLKSRCVWAHFRWPYTWGIRGYFVKT